MQSLRPLIVKRGLHVAPRLPLQSQFAKEGISGLMSKEQFNTAWIEYQDYLTKNLSLRTVGTEFETRSPLSIVLSTARKQQLGPIFHYASQAHNNHLFFQQLAPSVTSQPAIKPALLSKINEQFTSLENFKNEFLFKADSLTGNGWVFLVETEDKTLKIIQCNNDGTPYFYGRNQSLDLNGAIDLSDYELLIANKEKTLENAKDYSLPLLCVNVWEQAYIEDYGVTGKADYLEKFWSCINWEVINKRVFSNVQS
ncbi:DEKNAAC101353 [Brettanomyces naardenensis]|uniref:DEKNAAC101353 n=1 Tax=Brettanomyces naardenensis TaxID=13370 RepID=A0A448YHZ4_BRENA|nr:DEKNAAC101353 [Brettanomyces naardenensis]